MNSWNDFADRMRQDVPLARRTWFRLGGNARYLFQPRDAHDLAAFMRCAARRQVPVKVLGAGANVLVSDEGFDGIVVKLDAPAFRTTATNDDTLTVGGGVELMGLSRQASGAGFSGLECMAGIPATVGGAVRMNAGGRFGEIGDAVREVALVARDGDLQTWTRDQLGFGYRRSSITDQIVVSAKIGVQQVAPSESAGRFAEYYAFKERSQPMKARSAGCIFKNPDGVSAGALIDRAGLKGLRRGGAEVSSRHANFIVTRRGALASDVILLIEKIRIVVGKMFGTELETEIDIW